MGRRIAILGGTFDPIHIGHLILAVSAREQLCADQVLLVPNQRSPMKSQPPVASFTDRMGMITLAISGIDGLAVSEIEGRRGETSYTVDTLRQFVALHPADEYYLILGSDALMDFPSWKEHADILRLAKLAVVERGTAPTPTTLPVAARIQMPAINVSSTIIRDRLARGLSIDFLTPPAVAACIRSQRLYMPQPGASRALD